MSEKKTLTVAPRTATGKGPVRRLREEGFVPGVFYNAEGANVNVQVKELPLRKLWSAVGSNQVFTLAMESDGKEYPALIWELMPHPYKNRLDHVDFYGVDPEKPVKVMVPVETTGVSKGVKLGGRLEMYRDSLEVLCMPGLIPASIVIDITKMSVNDYVHVEDLEVADGVEIIHSDNFPVVAVLSSRAVEDDEDEEGGDEEEETES